MCIVNSFVEISTLKNNELPLIGYLNDDLVLSKNHNLSECSSIFFCIKRLDAIVMAFRMGEKTVSIYAKTILTWLDRPHRLCSRL